MTNRPPSPQEINRYYSSLSDEALKAVPREHLSRLAREIYDDEMAARELPGEEDPFTLDFPDTSGESPEWLSDSVAVYSRTGTYSEGPAEEALVMAALEDAGIPCFMETFESDRNGPMHGTVAAWRIFVPGELSQRASSLVDAKIFNQEFEDEWRTHLEMVSDAELLTLEPREAFCGLYDRIDRVTRVYAEELERRGLEK